MAGDDELQLELPLAFHDDLGVKRRPAGKRGRPRRSIEEAREFAYLLACEREAAPKVYQEELFARIRERDPKRWGRMRNMYDLLAEFEKDRVQNPGEAAAWWRQRVNEAACLKTLRHYQTGGAKALEPRDRRADTGKSGDPD